MELSVVLISRNQEWNIARLIESVLARTASVAEREIVLVDSASTDRTVEIACGYPVTVLRLSTDQRLTSHAGRYTGFKNTTGEYVLFLDGDMELYDGWLEKALDVLAQRPEVAGVTGPWIDLPIDTRPGDPAYGQPPQAAEGPMKRFGGAGIYRRAVLDAVGPFNPHLHSDGEPEMCVRIRYAGYKLLQIAHPVAYHYSEPAYKISTLVGRRSRNLYKGTGQAMRYHFSRDFRLFLMYTRERGYAILPGLAVLVGMLGAARGCITGRWRLFKLWSALAGAALAGYAYRRRSVYQMVRGVVLRLFMIEGTIRGFFIPVDAHETYPMRFEVVCRAGEDDRVSS
jgi:glycosyltransferase involved in cell wall biosynthesis